MKRDNVNYLTVGTFVIVMMLALLFLLFEVTGRTGPAEEYYVVYRNVSGLKFGTGVLYEGYQVGQVETIEPFPRASGMAYKVTLSVREGWRIPSDSIARVVASGLISAVVINIEEGKDQAALAPGDEIPGAEQANLFAVLGRAASVFEQLSTDGIMPVLDNLNARISEVAAELVALNREEIRPFVSRLDTRINEELLPDLRRASGQLDRALANLTVMLGDENREKFGDILSHADDIAVNLNSLVARIEQTRQEMHGLLETVEGITSQNADGVTAAVEGARLSMQQLQLMFGTVNDHLGGILRNVESSSRNLNEFSRAIRDNPARLVRGTRSGGADAER